ncbi:MAG: hypothetical protein ACRDQ2_12730 [Gaiellales bacterium]
MRLRLPLCGTTPLALFAGLLPSLLIGVAGCAGGAMTTSISGTSPAPAPDAFTCVRDQLKTVGFTQSSYDTDELRVTARKFDESQRRPDVQFRRMVDRLEIQVAPDSGNAITSITVDAKTFAELTTHRGPTEEQEKTSETARAAAQTILQKCSQPVDSLSVPG